MEAHSCVSVQLNPNVDDFAPGDTVEVRVKVREGDRERVQLFQGVVIRRRGGGPATAFTVRRVAHGVGVERAFLLYSPTVESLKVLRRGKVRRAKLHYLRHLYGRAARIKEKGPPQG